MFKLKVLSETIFRWHWFVIFAAVAVLSLIFLLTNRFAPKLIFSAITLTTIVYIAIALIHHHHRKNLTIEIILEYVMTGALALILIQTLLF